MARTSASSCSATARSLAGKAQLAHRARRRVCVKRQPAGVLRTTRSGSPEDTDLERISPGGPRIKHLCDLFVIESGAGRGYELVNTAFRPRGGLETASRYF